MPTPMPKPAKPWGHHSPTRITRKERPRTKPMIRSNSHDSFRRAEHHAPRTLTPPGNRARGRSKATSRNTRSRSPMPPGPNFEHDYGSTRVNALLLHDHPRPSKNPYWRNTGLSPNDANSDLRREQYYAYQQRMRSPRRSSPALYNDQTYQWSEVSPPDQRWVHRRGRSPYQNSNSAAANTETPQFLQTRSPYRGTFETGFQNQRPGYEVPAKAPAQYAQHPPNTNDRAQIKKNIEKNNEAMRTAYKELNKEDKEAKKWCWEYEHPGQRYWFEDDDTIGEGLELVHDGVEFFTNLMGDGFRESWEDEMRKNGMKRSIVGIDARSRPEHQRWPNIHKKAILERQIKNRGDF